MTLYETKEITWQSCLEHILVVDDIQTNLRLAKAFLNGGGYQNVYLESDPFRVSEWLNSVDINLLILDLSMPEKDGISLFVELFFSLRYMMTAGGHKRLNWVPKPLLQNRLMKLRC